MKFLLSILLLLSFYSYSQDACVPIGWATQNGGTTGGGNTRPIIVNNITDLQLHALSPCPSVIYISGTIGSGVNTRIKISSNKTIIGLPGSKLIGGFNLKSISNVIIRNIKIQGPGSMDVNGVDCITIDSSTNIWIDHCEIYDGQDGNLDIVNGSNFISITWTQFYYTSVSKNHRYCILIGNSDNKISDRDKLKVTMMYNWYSKGIKERIPRVRYGQVHIVNNYFNSPGNNHCIRAGREANILVENNLFEGVRTPIELFVRDFVAVTSIGNVLISTNGNSSGSGNAFKYPYQLNIISADSLKKIVTDPICGAGSTMRSPDKCGCEKIN